MADRDWLMEQFEANRAHLRAVGYRMLGSRSEAEDAVQEAWLRLNRADTSEVENLAGWLTTVVARVSLDMLRSRSSRCEQAMGDLAPEAVAVARGGVGGGPEHDAEMADAVGPARPGRRVASSGPSSASRWPTGRSSRSTWWATGTSSTSSTWSCCRPRGGARRDRGPDAAPASATAHRTDRSTPARSTQATPTETARVAPLA